MTYDARERSQDEANPVTLFLFTYGTRATDIFAYTDFDRPVTYRGVEYQPRSIAREKIESAGEGLDNLNQNIRITPSAEIVTYLQRRTPSQEISVVLRQGHFDDPDEEYLVIWSGRVVGQARKDLHVEIGCESILTAIRRNGLKRRYQRSCPWALYSTECGAARRGGFPIPPAVIGTNVVVLPGGWNGAFAADKFKGGYISWSDVDTDALHVRTIIDVGDHAQGTEIIIQGRIEGLLATTLIATTLGCNHLIGDCRQLHGNIVNFGGQPYIPTDNPVGFINRFY